MYVISHTSTRQFVLNSKTFNNIHLKVILTESISNFEQKKQTHLKILIVFVKKPMWNTGLANSIWPKWPGHSDIFPAQVMHLAFLSIVPCLGSIRPLILGLPPSMVSENLIPPSVTENLRWKIKYIGLEIFARKTRHSKENLIYSN